MHHGNQFFTGYFAPFFWVRFSIKIHQEKENYMSKSITEQIADLQNENDRLKELDKLFEKAIKTEFGCDRKTIKKMMKNTDHIQSDFEKKIINYFNLKTASDMEEFLSIILSENTRNYFNNKKSGNTTNGDR